MRARAGLLALLALLVVLPATAVAAGSPVESLNGYAPPTCTTADNVTLGGVCEDVPTSAGTLTDPSGGAGQGTFGPLANSVFAQAFRLVTDNMPTLLLFLAAMLTWGVIRYLSEKTGSDGSEGGAGSFDRFDNSGSGGRGPRIM